MNLLQSGFLREGQVQEKTEVRVYQAAWRTGLSVSALRRRLRVAGLPTWGRGNKTDCYLEDAQDVCADVDGPVKIDHRLRAARLAQARANPFGQRRENLSCATEGRPGRVELDAPLAAPSKEAIYALLHHCLEFLTPEQASRVSPVWRLADDPDNFHVSDYQGQRTFQYGLLQAGLLPLKAHQHADAVEELYEQELDGRAIAGKLKISAVTVRTVLHPTNNTREHASRLAMAAKKAGRCRAYKEESECEKGMSRLSVK